MCGQGFIYIYIYETAAEEEEEEEEDAVAVLVEVMPYTSNPQTLNLFLLLHYSPA